jgi:hypothetical protein
LDEEGRDFKEGVKLVEGVFGKRAKSLYELEVW